MACFALVEAIALFMVLFWPVPVKEKVYQDVVFSDNEIVMEEVQITTQKNTPPPPPRPQIPIPVPNDQVIEEEILLLEDIDLPEYDDSLFVEGSGPAGSSDKVTANPQISPGIIRIVEPTVPEAAKKAGVKAEMWITFLVDKEGKVEEATIAEIRVYDKNGDDYTIRESIGYGLIEATINAALQWKFRPAKNGGDPVKAYTTHTISYGF